MVAAIKQAFENRNPSLIAVAIVGAVALFGLGAVAMRARKEPLVEA